MNVTRAMIEDLLPLYAAGEASADTRAAVEAFLREDAELARQLEALREDAPLGALPARPVEPEAGRRTIARTQALLRRRTWVLAAAIFLTLLPFTFFYGDDGLEFLFLRDAPVAAAVCLAGAVASWAGFLVTTRRLRVKGL
jgi:anti-sigma factor RsiW